VRFTSFQARLLTWFLGLFVLVEAAGLYLVGAAQERNARDQIDAALEVGAGVFHRLIDARAERLTEAARLLSADFAFKQACAIGDRATILSVLQNQQSRIGADLMLLADLDYAVVADTLNALPSGGALPFASAIEDAVERGEDWTTTMVLLGGRPYQVVVVPLLAPLPTAWIAVGFRLGDPLANEIRRLTLTHVSLLRRDDDGAWQPFATTLPKELRAALAPALGGAGWVPDRSVTLPLAGEGFVTLVTSLEAGTNPVVAVLQRSLPEALAPFRRLRAVLLGLFGGGVLLTAIAAQRIARLVTRPVLEIAARARRVEEGDYGEPLRIRQQDELGQLAVSFNRMVQGLAERDRVRGLLGLVVSPAVAHELLTKAIALGGEERDVTVLFADIRDFTSLSEQRSPQEILALLNSYLTCVTAVVEANGGVVDKYIGDGMMALFGAPLSHPDDASRAVRTALQMIAAVGAWNRERDPLKQETIRIGIGIHTGRAVAGNMGSATRLNYTVIGDAVNLASRLEELSKTYGTAIVASMATRESAPGFDYREIDRVRVRGRDAEVTIFEVVAEAGPSSPAR
jgi:adenylate cyclase